VAADGRAGRRDPGKRPHAWLEIGVRREMLEPILDVERVARRYGPAPGHVRRDAPFAFGRKPGAKARVIAGQMLANPFTGRLPPAIWKARRSNSWSRRSSSFS
jgi:hypothetical protein